MRLSHVVARRRGISNHKMSSRAPYQMLEYGIPLRRATQVSIAERRGNFGFDFIQDMKLDYV